MVVIWVIIVQMGLLNLDSQTLLSDRGFTSRDACMSALVFQPRSDRAICRPIGVAVPQPQGEPVERAPTEEGAQ